jgi:DNA mismatch endonuclease (patch repair protein)
MSRVRRKNTAPELLVRRLLSERKVRYRLHLSSLPGTPDLYVGRLKLAIFVNGCFWHGHENCKRATRPRTNVDFWTDKISRNVARDQRVVRELKLRGVDSIVIWACNRTAMKRACSLVARRYLAAAAS